MNDGWIVICWQTSIQAEEDTGVIVAAATTTKAVEVQWNHIKIFKQKCWMKCMHLMMMVLVTTTAACNGPKRFCWIYHWRILLHAKENATGIDYGGGTTLGYSSVTFSLPFCPVLLLHSSAVGSSRCSQIVSTRVSITCTTTFCLWTISTRRNSFVSSKQLSQSTTKQSLLLQRFDFTVAFHNMKFVWSSLHTEKRIKLDLVYYSSCYFIL